MPAQAFLDTNILVYAFLDNDRRRPASESLVHQGHCIGMQTLNEYINVERNKFRQPWDAIATRLRAIELLCPPPVPLTKIVHYRGVQIARSHGYHIYDSMMLAAALTAECTTFYSEDMQHGQVIDGMTIVNPFL